MEKGPALCLKAGGYFPNTWQLSAASINAVGT